MKKICGIFLALVFAVSAHATIYYGAATGCSDANLGTSSGSPWCTPNHAVNAGDIIQWAAGAYTTASFPYGSWGAVAGTGHYVAWNICATPFACSVVNTTAGPAMWVSASHWAISGFVFSQPVAANDHACIDVYNAGGPLQDVIIANNVFNGCYGNSVAVAGNDYMVFIANAVYNTAQESSQCASGISINVPMNTDTLPGTHIYVAQNFMWGNTDPSPCAGGSPTDGEGLILDTWDANAYTGRGTVENNIALYNGSSGFQVWNTNGLNAFTVHIRNNTAWANNASGTRTSALCGEIAFSLTNGLMQNIEIYDNIGVTNAASACGSNTLYAFLEMGANATDKVYHNWGYSATSSNHSSQYSSGFVVGPDNIFGTDPVFANPPLTIPSAPDCSSFATVPACMSSLIAGLTPTNASAQSKGYQRVSNNPNFNSLYPHWLCQYPAQLSGLVTQGCAVGAELAGTMAGAAIQ